MERAAGGRAALPRRAPRRAPAGRALAAGVAWALAPALARAEEAPQENATTKPYVPPEVVGLHWAETFDGDVWSRWKASAHDKYNGKFSVELRKQEAFEGDLGLLVPDEARHYGAFAAIPALAGAPEVPFVLQYEVRFQEGLTCGGAYLKLFDSSAAPAGFQDDTRYVVMFGPDRCGGTNKVHFILQHRNPKTGKWEEKHFKEPPSVPHDNLSHLYGLVVNPDNSVEMLVDGETKASGSLLTSMEPPVNPPKEIDDPADKKPGDWVDEAKMDDPKASKPDDWDEDAPMLIPDPKESKPAGWLDDEPLQIPDPKSEKPEDWDDEEDGEWEAPMIANPACKVGCGKWEHPRIDNPEYKGKWHAPKIDNPEYKGVWRPRQIPNPDFFVDETPSALPKIDSVGIDIWTMSKGILFDNIVVSTDVAKAKAFGDATFKPRRELELQQQPKPKTTFWDDPLAFASEPKALVSIGVTVLCLVLATAWCCFRGDSTPKPLTPEEKRALRKKRKEEAERQEREAGAKDAADGEGSSGAASSKEGAGQKDEANGKEPAEESNEGEGDDGDDSKEDKED